MNASLLRKLIVEFIGTFFLVYVIGCVSLQDHVLLGPLAIGASLMVMIFAGGHISGAHYNPAVTLGVWIRGACSALEASLYIVAQVIGAIVAALAAGFLLGHGSSPAASTLTAAHVMLAEALGTFALVYTVLNVATAPATSGNSFYGLAIGFTVFAQAVTEIPGIGATGAQIILAEIGLDMTQFPTAAHLVSWAKLCPRT
ncbi:MAG: aquaporin, partial [Verrucomicrobiota bacterium]